MRVLVTRPAGQAGEWVERLVGRGLDAVALPLIAIDGPPDPAALEAAWRSLPARALVVFVSPNAVTRFFAARPSGCAWPPGLRAGAPGPGTGAALRAAGVPAGAIVEPPPDSPSFDSEALWAVLAPRGPLAGRRGADRARRSRRRGRAAGTWPRLAGADAAGRRRDGRPRRRLSARPPRFDDAQQSAWERALRSPAEHVWLFSSSEAIDQLAARLPPGPAATAWPRWRALATHARIAERARAAGFGRVVQAAPRLDDVAAALRALDTPSIESDAP
jgi:uroporphyrinogen-III synthase